MTSVLLDLAHDIVTRARAQKQILVTAESCTGGLVASLLTEIPGSSAMFDCGFVTYSNAAKQQLLFVPEQDLLAFGAVSAEVAMAMARGALTHSRGDMAISLTGIAGPDGGTAEKPVGLVFLGYQQKGKMAGFIQLNLTGNRRQIREQAAAAALEQFRLMMADTESGPAVQMN